MAFALEKTVALRRLAVVAAIALSALVVAGCTAQTTAVPGSSISVALDNPFYSYNPGTSFGDSPANFDIAYATNSGFNYFDNTQSLVRDESFGHYEKLSDNPLIVKYTVADGVTWSDGAPVDAADLLLAWAAQSAAFNTPGFDPATVTDPNTGQFTDAFPSDVVYFDSGARSDVPAGLSLVSKLPQISADRKSITLVYDKPYVDWESAFFGTTTPGLPAHVVARHALGVKGDQAAKDAVIAAIDGDDTTALAAISRFWNTGFNLTGMPSDADLLASTGPYTISGFVPDQYVTLTANKRYVGDRSPRFEQITVRFVTDPLSAVQALNSGEVQVISPKSSADVVSALSDLDFTLIRGYDSSFEQLSLQFTGSKNGVFTDQRVRQAFLKMIPRREIVDKLVVPLQKDAVTRDSQVFVPGSKEYAASVRSNDSAGYATVDIAGATALLAAAGIPNPTVCILYDPTNPQRAQEFALIQKSAALAGFVVTDCGNANWRSVLGTSDAYDASLFAWQSSGPGVIANSTAYRSDGANNFTGYSNKDVDGLLDKLDDTFDATAQAGVLKQVDKILWDDGYGVPIFQFPAITAFDATKVTGIAPSSLSPGVFWNVWRWAPANDNG
ncbi:MAG: ABC transporter family substrate-binding protein [Rhodoglobus sp.]